MTKSGPIPASGLHRGDCVIQPACGKSPLKGTLTIRDTGIVLSWEKVLLSLSQMGRYDMNEKDELFHWKA